MYRFLFFIEKMSMHRQTLILCPKVALAVRARCQSFRTNRYVFEKLCDFKNFPMGKWRPMEYMELNGSSYQERALFSYCNFSENHL